MYIRTFLHANPYFQFNQVSGITKPSLKLNIYFAFKCVNGRQKKHLSACNNVAHF